MEITYLIVAVAVIFYFGKAIKAMADSAERVVNTGAKIVDTVAEVTDDTAGTYAFDVKLDNAEHRSELAVRAANMTSIVTLDDLSTILAGKTTKARKAA